MLRTTHFQLCLEVQPQMQQIAMPQHKVVANRLVRKTHHHYQIHGNRPLVVGPLPGLSYPQPQQPLQLLPQLLAQQQHQGKVAMALMRLEYVGQNGDQESLSSMTFSFISVLVRPHLHPCFKHQACKVLWVKWMRIQNWCRIWCHLHMCKVWWTRWHRILSWWAQ